MTFSADWDAATAEALGHFKELLRIDTTNPPGNERAATDYLARVLDAEGIPYRIVGERADPRELDRAPFRLGPKGAPPLERAPRRRARGTRTLALTIRSAPKQHDGCIWGRGAVDMKNMVAMSLMTLLMFTEGRGPSRSRRDLRSSGRRRSRLEARCALSRRASPRARAGGVRPERDRRVHVLRGRRRLLPDSGRREGDLLVRAHGTRNGRPRIDARVPTTAAVRIESARSIALGMVRLPVSCRARGRDDIRSRPRRTSPALAQRVVPLLVKPAFARLFLNVVRMQDPEQAIALEALLMWNTAFADARSRR